MTSWGRNNNAIQSLTINNKEIISIVRNDNNIVIYTKQQEEPGEITIYSTGIGLFTWGNVSFKSNGQVDWGDGYIESLSGDQMLYHKYSDELSGHTITISRVTAIPQSFIRQNNQNYGVSSVTILNSITTLPKYSFQECSDLTSFAVYGNKLTSIQDYCFYECTALNSVSLPDSLTSISTSAFESCSNLTNITIPSNVTSIGSFCFYSCSKLSNIIFTSQTPPSLGTNCFSGISSSCVIYVPRGSLSAYRGASNMPNPNVYTYVEY